MKGHDSRLKSWDIDRIHVESVELSHSDFRVTQKPVAMAPSTVTQMVTGSDEHTESLTDKKGGTQSAEARVESVPEKKSGTQNAEERTESVGEKKSGTQNAEEGTESVTKSKGESALQKISGHRRVN